MGSFWRSITAARKRNWIRNTCGRRRAFDLSDPNCESKAVKPGKIEIA
jgi:hypothetical protein